MNHTALKLDLVVNDLVICFFRRVIVGSTCLNHFKCVIKVLVKWSQAGPLGHLLPLHDNVRVLFAQDGSHDIHPRLGLVLLLEDVLRVALRDTFSVFKVAERLVPRCHVDHVVLPPVHRALRS